MKFIKNFFRSSEEKTLEEMESYYRWAKPYGERNYKILDKDVSDQSLDWLKDLDEQRDLSFLILLYALSECGSKKKKNKKKKKR